LLLASQLPLYIIPGARRIRIADVMLDVIHEYKDGIWHTSVTIEAKGWISRYKAPPGQDAISPIINGKAHKGKRMIDLSI
jgi:hypothetical protein